MNKGRDWLCFKQLFLFPAKRILLKVTSGFMHKNKGNRAALLSLYKDMESCREYEDIQVMWAMIHSSCPQNSCNTRRNKRPRPFCFPFCG
ncbi:hypothetical protein Patl1_31421 [Pistacia atlantica]|uniref:Uncharacterized protein n=1 Tax=Pistacia atlantica TaxID=434234 RepID=A0ACC1AQ90_9ROSI|nr:hypothetical protein Patl1_31421 [Pistacia atlantica]